MGNDVSEITTILEDLYPIDANYTGYNEEKY